VTGGVVDGGAVYNSTVFEAAYNQLFDIDLALIELVEE
jgi:hypothetical protein